jgi:hypothetical protein
MITDSLSLSHSRTALFLICFSFFLREMKER